MRFEAIASLSGRTVRRMALAVVCTAAVIQTGDAPGAGGATIPLPKVTDCGDIAAGTWLIRDRVTGKGLTGRHYSVHTVRFPCATARTLVAKLTRRRSLGRGPTALLPGFMCLTGIPAGLQLEHGGCAIGTSPMLVPSATTQSFRWQACRAIPARREHTSCSTRKLG